MRKKKAKNSLKFKIILIIIFIIIVCSFIYSLFNSELFLNSSFSIIFVCRGSGGSLFSNQAEDQSRQSFYIPEALSFNTAYNLGRYKFGSIFTLGEQQEIGGGVLLLKTLRSDLSIPVDFFIYSPKPCLSENNSHKLNLNKILFSSLITTPGKSNLSLVDKAKLIYLLNFSKRANWVHTDLNKYTIKEGDDFILEEKGIREHFLFSFTDKRMTDKDVTFEVANISVCADSAASSIKLLNNLGIYATLSQEKHEDGSINTDKSYLFFHDKNKLNKIELDRLRRIIGFSRYQSAPDISTDFLYLIGGDYCNLPN